MEAQVIKNTKLQTTTKSLGQLLESILERQPRFTEKHSTAELSTWSSDATDFLLLTVSGSYEHLRSVSLLRNSGGNTLRLWVQSNFLNSHACAGEFCATREVSTKRIWRQSVPCQSITEPADYGMGDE